MARAEKVFEFALKALKRVDHEIAVREEATSSDELELYILEQTRAALGQTLSTKQGAWQFTNTFLLPYWKDGKFNEKQLEIDARSQLQQQVIEIIKNQPELAEKLENTEQILKKSEDCTRFLYGYFTAMCDYATCKA